MTVKSGKSLNISSSSWRSIFLFACCFAPALAYNIIERRPVSSDAQRLHPFPKSVQSYACSSLDGPSCRFLQEKDDITSSIASAELDEIVDATLVDEKSGAATKTARINFKIGGAVSEGARKAAAQFGAAFLEMINTQLSSVTDDNLLKKAQAGDADATAELQKNLQAKLESMMDTAAKEAKSVLASHDRGRNEGGAGVGAGGGASGSSGSSKGKQSKKAPKVAGGAAQQPGASSTSTGSKAASSGTKAATAAASNAAKTVAAAAASVNAILAELGKIPGQHAAVDLDAIMNRLDGLAKQVGAQPAEASSKKAKTKAKGKGKGQAAAAPAASAGDDQDQWGGEDDEHADDTAHHMDGDDDGYYDDYEEGDEMDGDDDDQGVIYDPDERDKAVLSL
jgi:hypothetical protein